MKLLKLEFFKYRRRKILLVCAAVLAAELLWLVTTFLRQDAEDGAVGQVPLPRAGKRTDRKSVV